MSQRYYLLRNACWLAPLGVLQTTIYLSLNADPLFPSTQLPMTWIDEAVPFWVWTIWPYLMLLTCDVMLPLPVRNVVLFYRMILSHILAMCLTLAFWVFVPSNYPRPPAPEDDSWSSQAYRDLIAMDSPECCFPSGHILIPVIGCWGLCRDRPSWKWWLCGGLGMLSLTILTTKQHYFWDLLGGLGAAAFGIVLSGLAFKWAASSKGR